MRAKQNTFCSNTHKHASVASRTKPIEDRPDIVKRLRVVNEIHQALKFVERKMQRIPYQMRWTSIVPDVAPGLPARTNHSGRFSLPACIRFGLQMHTVHFSL